MGKGRPLKYNRVSTQLKYMLRRLIMKEKMSVKQVKLLLISGFLKTWNQLLNSEDDHVRVSAPPPRVPFLLPFSLHHFSLPRGRLHRSPQRQGHHCYQFHWRRGLDESGLALLRVYQRAQIDSFLNSF